MAKIINKGDVCIFNLVSGRNIIGKYGSFHVENSYYYVDECLEVFNGCEIDFIGKMIDYTEDMFLSGNIILIGPVTNDILTDKYNEFIDKMKRDSDDNSKDR